MEEAADSVVLGLVVRVLLVIVRGVIVVVAAAAKTGLTGSSLTPASIFSDSVAPIEAVTAASDHTSAVSTTSPERVCFKTEDVADPAIAAARRLRMNAAPVDTARLGSHVRELLTAVAVDTTASIDPTRAGANAMLNVRSSKLGRRPERAISASGYADDALSPRVVGEGEPTDRQAAAPA